MRPNGKSINIKSLKSKGEHDFLIGNVEVLGNNEIVGISRTKKDYQLN